MTLREAAPADVHAIRLRVRENRLSDPSVVTGTDYHDFMARDTMRRLVAHAGTVIGVVMVHVAKKNRWALFVNPSAKGSGWDGRCTARCWTIISRIGKCFGRARTRRSGPIVSTGLRAIPQWAYPRSAKRSWDWNEAEPLQACRKPALGGSFAYCALMIHPTTFVRR